MDEKASLETGEAVVFRGNASWVLAVYVVGVHERAASEKEEEVVGVASNVVAASFQMVMVAFPLALVASYYKNELYTNVIRVAAAWETEDTHEEGGA